MNNLNSILNMDLNKISLYDLNEENLIIFKAEDYYTQSNFYFWLVNRLNILSAIKNKKEIAYGNFLMSYYLLIIFTPLHNEEISFNCCENAIELDPTIKYKEWKLIYFANPKGFLTHSESISLAKEVLEVNPNSELANMIIGGYNS